MFAKTRKQPARSLARAALGLPVVAALAGITYSKLFVPHKLALPPALDGERRELNGRAGQVSYYVAGQGRPLLLIHSVNAAASAYEVKPLFDHYRTSRRVYALDLPGFGFSDRSARAYTPRLFTDAILDLYNQIARDNGPAPIDALALSLGSEFLARAASEQPARFSTIALISPTGIRKKDAFYGTPGSVRGSTKLQSVWHFPLWSQPIFDLLNSRASQRYYLVKSFGSDEAVDQGLLDYDYLSAHQPDAQNAPYAFVSALLFSADITSIYQSLELPVWLAHGVRGDFTDYGGKQQFAARPNWHFDVFSTGGLPHFEQLEAFTAAYNTFLHSADR